jgi:hypothetical protein
MAYTVAPFPYHQFFTDAGAIAAGYKLYTYESGTTTALATYSDSAGTANANPIVLDSAGRAKIFLPKQAMKFVLKTDADVTVWTIDDVSPSPEFDVDWDVAGTAGEALSAGDLVYLDDGSGGTAGRWYKADADNTYSSTTAAAIGMAPDAIASGASGNIRLGGRVTGLSGLTAGTAYYASATAGALTSSAPANARYVGVAESTTVLIVSPWAGLVPASGTVPGLMTAGAQTIGGAKTFSGALVGSSTLDITGQSTFDLGPTFAAGGTGTDTQCRATGVLSYSTSANASTSNTETDLFSYTLPANTLSRNGMVIRVTAGGITAANANNKTVQLYFGTGTKAAVNSAANGKAWRGVWDIMRTSLSGQVLFSAGATDGENCLNQSLVTSQDETAAITIKTTGQGTTDNDITQYYFYAEVIGA